MRTTNEHISDVSWGICDSPFGPMRIGFENSAIVEVSFLDSGIYGDDDNCNVNPSLSARCAEIVAEWCADGEVAHVINPKGTAFQKKVWLAARNIRRGTVLSYADLTSRINWAGDKRNLCRAVGNALGANPIALFIPCHRVVRASGAIGGYRWGIERKCSILHYEGYRLSQ